MRSQAWQPLPCMPFKRLSLYHGAIPSKLFLLRFYLLSFISLPSLPTLGKIFVQLKEFFLYRFILPELMQSVALAVFTTAVVATGVVYGFGTAIWPAVFLAVLDSFI